MAPNLTRTRLIRSSGHTGVIRSVTSTLASLTANAGASTTGTSLEADRADHNEQKRAKTPRKVQLSIHYYMC